MSHLKPLRDILFRYRKRKKHSIDGSVPGMPYQRYRRFTTPHIGSPIRQSGYQQKDYLGAIPDQYRPNMFSPAVDWTEYQPHNDEFTPILKTPQVHSPLGISLSENPMPVASSDELSMTELFQMNSGARPRPQEGPIPVEFEEIRHLLEGVRVPLHKLGSLQETDSEEAIPFADGIHGRLHIPENEQHPMLPDLEQITEALDILQDRLPRDHPDVINLREAQKQMSWQQFLKIKQSPDFLGHNEQSNDEWQSKLGSGNPYENDDLIELADEYDDLASKQDIDREAMQREMLVRHDVSLLQEVQDLEQKLFADEMPEDTVFQKAMAQEPMLEEVVEQGYEQSQFQAGGVEMAEPDTMFGPPIDIANAGQPEQFMGLEVFDTNPASKEINQAIDQAAAFEQSEMDPWKKQYDPFQQMAMMMDMQMPYMANPFQMPGQMGPGFGPMPGPM